MQQRALAKIIELLDVISVEVGANRNETAELRAELRNETGGLRNELRNETAELRKEMRTGFDRVDRRLGKLETRVEDLETEVKAQRVELRSFRGEFERRIAPLETP